MGAIPKGATEFGGGEVAATFAMLAASRFVVGAEMVIIPGSSRTAIHAKCLLLREKLRILVT
jgi:hypothetical protein